MLRDLQREGGEGAQEAHMEGEQRGGGRRGERPEQAKCDAQNRCEPVAGSSLLPEARSQHERPGHLSSSGGWGAALCAGLCWLSGRQLLMASS